MSVCHFTAVPISCIAFSLNSVGRKDERRKVTQDNYSFGTGHYRKEKSRKEDLIEQLFKRRTI